MEENNYIELEQVRSIIYIPENTIDIEMKVRVYCDGKIETVSRKLDMTDVRKSIKDAEDNYMEDDDTFVLTDKGFDYLKSLNE